ncbi:hypothetical protein HDU82_007932, partial [Entophlyctis luteolus]
PLGYIRDEGAPLTPAESIHQLPIARERISQLELQIEHLQEHIDTLEKERAGVKEEKASFAQAFEDERRFLKMEIEEEREKNLKMLDATTRLEKMVSELNVMKDAINKDVNFRNNEQASSAVQKLKREISQLESIIAEKAARISTLEDRLKRFDAAPSDEILLKEPEMYVQLEYEKRNGRKVVEIESLCAQKTAENEDIEKELAIITAERDDLLTVLGKIESQLSDMTEVVEQLTSDRDNFCSLYQQVKFFAKQIETQLSTSTAKKGIDSISDSQNAKNASLASVRIKSSSPPHSSKIMLEDNLQEKKYQELLPKLEAANGRIRELESRCRELDDEVLLLQGDLRAVVFRQREAGVNAAETIRQIETERDSMRSELDSKCVVITALEEKVNLLTEKLSFKDQDIANKDRKIDDMLGGVTMMEVNLNDANIQLKETRSKLQETQNKLDVTDQALSKAQIQIREQSEKISGHSALLLQVDQDRDKYRNEIDLATERISELRTNLASTQASLNKSQTDLAQAYENIENMVRQLNDQDKEIGGFQSQLRILTAERDRLMNEQARANEDLRNLSADLAAMTRESQSLNGEMTQTKVVRERESLRAEIAECDSQIRYLEALVRDKDSERDHAMSSYMKMSAERDHLDVQLRSASEEIAELRMEVIMRDKRIVQMQNECEDLETELTKSKAEKQRLLREMGAIRDLAQSVDRNRENTQMEFSAAKLENERLRKMVERAESEHEHLLNELRSERMKYERIEKLLASERTKKVVVETSERETVLNHQAASLASAASELADANQRLLAARQEIGRLESVIRAQNEELEKHKDSLSKPSRSPPVGSGDGEQAQRTGESELEMRIKSELESTKEQLRAYEVCSLSKRSQLIGFQKQIEERMSRTSTPK